LVVVVGVSTYLDSIYNCVVSAVDSTCRCGNTSISKIKTKKNGKKIFDYTRKMTVGETIKKLIKAENYAEVRVGISDDFIRFVRDMLPNDYEYIEEKEQAYQDLIKLLKDDR
jgi:hypothetical protein